MSDNDTERSRLSRRRWLQATAAGSAGLLAGCGSDGGDGGDGGDETTTTGEMGDDDTTEETTEETTTTTTQQFLDQTYRRGVGKSNLLELEMAPQGSSYWWEFAAVLMAMGGRFGLAHNEYLKFAYDDVTVDEGAGEFKVTIRDGHQWHRNGEKLGPVTGEDIVFQEDFKRRLVAEEDRADDPLITDWRADGKTAIAEFRSGGFNSRLAYPRYIHEFLIDHYRDGIYADKYEALVDATSSDEKQQIRTEVTEMSARVDEKPLSGPWMLEDAAQQRMRFSLNKDYWVADHINYDKHEVRTITGTGNAGYAACRSDQVETCGVPTTVADAPDYIKQVVASQGDGGGQAFIIPYGSPAPEVFWKDPEIAAKARQAIAHAFSNEVALGNQYSLPDGAERPSRGAVLDKCHQLQSAAMAKDTFGEDTYEQFPEYTKDQERSAELLREAGFTEDGGEWYMPNGDRFEFDIVMIGWTQGIVRTVQAALENMGIGASSVKMGGQKYIQSYWDQREYETIVSEMGPNVGPPSRWISYWWDPNGEATILPPGFEDRDAEYDTYPVPPVGEFDAEPTEEVDPIALVNEFKSKPESELKEEVTRLCWMSAYHLQCYPIHFFPNENGLNVRHFEHAQPTPEFQEKWGNNFGVATEEHNPIYNTTQIRHQVMRGAGGEVGEAPILATDEE